MKSSSGISLAVLLAVALGTGTLQGAAVVGLTAGNRLVLFDSGAPGSISSSLAVTGLAAGQTLVGIDFRPSTGGLVGLALNGGTGSAQIYTLSSSGIAAPIGGLFALAGSAFGVDFNPVPDALRIVSSNEENRRITAGGGGTVNIDANLSSTGSPDPNLQVVGAAYSNSFPGGGTTTLYVIDAASGNLFTQGSLNSSPTSPNTGQLFLVGSLGLGTGLGDRIGFDILGTGSAFASVNNNFYTINLSTGAASLVGAVGTTELLQDITLAPVPEPATCALAALGLAALAFSRRRR